MRTRGRLRVLGAVSTLIVIGVLLMGLSATGAGPSLTVETIPPPISFHQVTIFASEDTWIDAWRPSANNATIDLTLRSGNVASALINFPLDSIPYHADAAVAQATLKLYVIGSTNYQPLWAYAYGVNRDWIATEATWDNATAAERWLLPGCDAVPEDRSGSATSEKEIYDFPMFIDLDVTDIVRSWLNGSAPANGILVRASSGASVAWKLASAEYLDATKRPQLQVVFTTIPTPTPTVTPSPTPVISALLISKTGPVGPLDLTEGSRITYTITVRNIGTDVATNVVVTDVLPYGTSFVAGTTGAQQSGEYVIWRIGDLPAGMDATFGLVVSLETLYKDRGLVANVCKAMCDNGCTEVLSDWQIVINPVLPTGTATPKALRLPIIFR